MTGPGGLELVQRGAGLHRRPTGRATCSPFLVWTAKREPRRGESDSKAGRQALPATHRQLTRDDPFLASISPPSSRGQKPARKTNDDWRIERSSPLLQQTAPSQL